MSIKYWIRDESAFLRVTAAGICDDLDRLKEHVLAVNSAALSAGLTEVLVDERKMSYHLTTIDSFESGKFVARMSRFGITAAVVYNPDAESDSRFWETVAVNRGAMLRAFDDIDDAENWLRQRSSRRTLYGQGLRTKTVGAVNKREHSRLWTHHTLAQTRLQRSVRYSGATD
jgi:hypothetical protein